jgi:hypothetical protein
MRVDKSDVDGGICCLRIRGSKAVPRVVSCETLPVDADVGLLFGRAYNGTARRNRPRGTLTEPRDVFDHRDWISELKEFSGWPNPRNVPPQVIGGSKATPPLTPRPAHRVNNAERATSKFLASRRVIFPLR